MVGGSAAAAMLSLPFLEIGAEIARFNKKMMRRIWRETN
jgi:hypothetical protein